MKSLDRSWSRIGSAVALAAMLVVGTARAGAAVSAGGQPLELLLGELIRMSSAGERDAALELIELEVLESAGRPEPERAALLTARGILLSDASAASLDPGAVALEEAAATSESRAIESFDGAWALAGAGELRNLALYDAGALRLRAAERGFRAALAEAQAAGQPGGMGAAPGGAGSGDGMALPPKERLEELRAEFATARDPLLRRLRSDWRDADTRANIEWIQNRLREIDAMLAAIEEQEQQQNEDEQEQSDEQQDEQEQDEQSPDEQDGDESQQDEQPQDESESEQEQQDSQSEQESSEQESAEDQQPGEQPSDESDAAEEQDPSESEESQSESEESQANEEQQAAGQESTEDSTALSEEEVMRLLDRLAEIDEQGRQLRARMRRVKTRPVERDW